MNKSVLLFLFCFLPFVANSQVDKKYLAGVVPEVDGKVVFSRTITSAKNLSANQIYTTLEKWAQEKYNSEDNRVLLSDSKKQQIACKGVMKLVFQDAALSYDYANMNYQLLLEVEDGKCNALVRGIRYEYPDDKGKRVFYPAEDIIIDKYALNGEKLNRYYNKFRIHTVDSINDLFDNIGLIVGWNLKGDLSDEVVRFPRNETPQTNNDTETNMPSVTTQDRLTDPFPFRKTTADKIPGNIIKLLGEWTLITSGKGDKVNVMTASWGGLGRFWEKPVSFCFLNPTRYSVTTMDEGETYTISFYTEAYKEAMQYCGSVSGRDTDKIKGSGLTPIKLPSGATTFTEAWMVFECKKIVAQQISPDAVVDKDSLKNDWSKNGFHKMYIGEILNVWIK